MTTALRFVSHCRAALLATALLPAVPALADEQQAPPRSSADVLTDEILVTAQKRGAAERLQDVPIAITAFTADQLNARQFRTIENLSFSAPNVALDSVGTTPGVANFSIRGLGINSSIPSVDPTVGVFVDGIYLGVIYGVVLDTFDLEGVEVLRGPQGTLFGKNVTGGGVLIKTRAPSKDFHVSGRLSLETGLQWTATGSVEGPITPTLRAKLSVFHTDDSGWFTNSNPVVGGNNYGEERTTVIRPTIVYEPNDRFNLRATYEYGRTRGDGGVNQNYGRFSGFTLNVDNEGSTDLDWHQATVEANLNVDFGNGTITNLFGYRKVDHTGITDIDGTPNWVFLGTLATDQKQFSNELRYSGKFLNDRLTTTAGLFWFTQDFFYFERRQLAGGAVDTAGGGTQDQTTLGIFTENSFKVSDVFTLTGGLRWNREVKDVRATPIVVGASRCTTVTRVCNFTFSDRESWSNIMYRVGFQWQPIENAQMYGTMSNGFRSGGYNFRNTNPAASFGPFDEEKLTTFELGLKSDLFDRRLRFNVAGFFTNIKDMQREFILADPVAGLVQTIQNSADAHIYGFEVEAQAKVTDNWVVGGNLGVIEGDYTRVFADLNGDRTVDGRDRALKIPRLVPITWGLFTVLDVPLANDSKATLRANYQDRASAAFSDDNLAFLSPVKMFDASVSYSLPGDNVRFTLFGRNLLNANYEGVRAAVLGGIRYMKEGRVWGGEVWFRF